MNNFPTVTATLKQNAATKNLKITLLTTLGNRVEKIGKCILLLEQNTLVYIYII